MKEYGIYTICKGGRPYMVHIFNNIISAKLKLYDMIALEEERGRPYFVDNDFFDNKYSYCINSKYFRIDVREVTEYKKYSENEEIENNIKEDNKIIYFQNFKNMC